MFESRIYAGGNENYHARKIWVSLRGPMTWKVMPRSVWNDSVSWQTRRLNNSTKYLLHASMTTTSKKKNWNPWENCQKCALKIVLKCLFGTYWKNRYSMVSEQTCTIDHEIDQSFCLDYLVWSPTFITQVHTNNIVMWETLQNNADRDCFKTPIFAGDLEDFEIHFWRNIVRFWKSYLCSNKLDVQETNCCFSQFNRIWNHLSGHWTEIGWFTRSGTMGSNCFCSWKCLSCFRSIGETWEWWTQTPQVSQTKSM